MYLSPLEMFHPSSLECLLKILVIVWVVSSLVEVGVFSFWVLIVVLVYTPLNVGYPPLEVGWFSLAMVLLYGLNSDFYLIGSLCLT